MEVSTWKAARAARDGLDQLGKRLVFTNGCFDVLHSGHVRYLARARALGDALCVAINSDDSVRALKGPQRPVNGLEDRAEVVGALRVVDLIVVYHERRAAAAIEAIAPHIYVKGGDYTADSLDTEERAALEAAGAEIRILELVPGRSTTDTLKRLRTLERAGDRRTLRLGVLGSGRGTNMEAIAEAIETGRLEAAKIVLVISDVEGARILSMAEERGIEGVYVNPGPYRNRLGDAAQREIRDRLLAASVDLVLLAGFMRRLKAPVLEAFSERILNVHPSLLPKFVGQAAWEQALAAGESQTGATIHLVDAGIDTGRVLAQKVVPIRADDSARTLHARIQAVEHELYPRVIGEYGQAHFQP